MRRLLVGQAGRRREHHRGRRDRDVALPHVVAYVFRRPRERRAVAAAAARAQAERVAGLNLGDQHLGVGKVCLPRPIATQRDRIAFAVAAAAKSPRPAMSAVDIGPISLNTTFSMSMPALAPK